MATFSGTEGDDVLVGTSADDLFDARGGNDALTGSGGNDVFLGGGGDDTLNLDLGLLGANVADLGAGADVVSVTVAATAAARQVRLTFTSAEVGNGSIRDAGTLANQDGNLAVRFQAEDLIGGLSGPIGRLDDEGVTFVAGTGLTFDVRDLVAGTQRGDAFKFVGLGTSGVDLLTSTQAGATYYFNGGAGDDIFTGGTGSDFLVGGVGNDRFVASRGSDTVLGGDGFDTIDFGSTVGRGDGAVSRDAASGTANRFAFSGAAGNATDWTGVERVVFADGAVDYSTDALSVGVAHLYRAILGREADALGLSFHLDTIEFTGNLLTVANGLSASPEGRAVAAGTAATVERAYQGALGRSADTAGLAFWTGELTSGRATTASMATSLVASPEFDTGATGIAADGVVWTAYDAIIIDRGYQGLLGRNVEAEGLRFYDAGIDAGRLPLAGLLELITRSPEFASTRGNLSNAGYVDLLYDSFLGRDGDAAGTAFHLGQLAQGASRGQVAQGFLLSPETAGTSAVAALATNGVDLF